MRTTDELLEELRQRMHPLEECDNATLVYEMRRRLGLTPQEQDNLADCCTSDILIKALADRPLDHAQQLAMADLLDSPAQVAAMRLWLPMDGLNDEALWDSMTAAGRREYTKRELAEEIDFLRQALAQLEP